MSTAPTTADRARTASAEAPLLGKRLDPQRNSLNLIRLALASSVLFAHTYFVLGRPEEQFIFGGNHIGAWAVAGFFAASGYLITASRLRTGFAPFLLLRLARIYPAFIVVLLVTIAVFAPIAHLIASGTLVGYLRTATSPLNYFFLNMFLEVRSYSIGTTLAAVPYPDVWNGSLWTLFYEFLCYMIVGVLLLWRRARRSVWPVAAAFVVSVVLYARIDAVLTFFDGNASLRLLAMLAPYFLGGALLRFLLPRLGLHWIAGVLSLGVFLAAIQFGPMWASQATSPFLAYGLLWLASVAPQPKWIAEHDLSYGVYVYAFPLQQLLVVFGLVTLDPTVFSLIALAVTLCFAAASWFFVERPVLRRARVAVGRTPDR